MALAIAACLGPGDAAAQPVVLDPVVVTAPRAAVDWLETPVAISAIDAGALPGEQGLALDELLNRVPGLYAQNRYNLAQGVRLSIRGFGARAGFGVRGIRVLVDGVPLTMPDGQTELDGVDLDLVERVEVIRGPASTLYGNAAGGVVLVTTREPPEEFAAAADLRAGGYGYRQFSGEVGGGGAAVQGLAAINALRLDGYREHSEAEANMFTGKLTLPAEAGTLTAWLNAIDNETDDPGGLRAAEVEADRRQAAPNNIRFDAGESVQQQRLSVGWEGRSTAQRDYLVRLYVGQREFENRLPFQSGGQGAFDRTFGGVGGQYVRRLQAFGVPQQLTVGVDLEAQRDDRRRYDNLDGDRGAPTLRQEERAEAVGVFAHNTLSLSERWLGEVGVRYDNLRLAVDDEFLADGDDSGSRRLTDWSWSAGLSYRLNRHHRLYTRLATSFETPTINELANPAGGGFNPGLEAAQASNREIGLKAEWPRLRYELVLFSIDVEDELVPFELEGQAGRRFYRNAGESRRNGVELSADWRISDIWRVGAAYTYSDFEFERYVVDGVSFAGNEIPGIPRQQLFAELAYTRGGWYASANVNAFDRLYADDANSVRVSGYAVANLRFAYRYTAADLLWEPYVGVNNLFDKEYFGNVRTNATFGRYFEPAPERHFYAGLRVAY